MTNILNDLLNACYNKSKYRKQYQAFEKMLNANQSKIIDGDAYIKEIEVAKRELEDEVNSVKMIRGGSLAGSGCDYTIEKRLSGNPSQMVCICDKNGLKCFYPIILN